MATTPRTTDTIPRLSHLVAHLADQLAGMRDGSTTFEAARRRYRDTVDRLAIEGLGRRTATRVEEATAYWAPTADVLEEAMRLGLVEREQIPSAKRYVDAHRMREYRLTERGLRASELTGRRLSEFLDHLTEAIIDAHPYFRGLLELLDEAPLALPVITEGDLTRVAESGGSAAGLAEELLARIPPEFRPEALGADLLLEEIVEVARKRFGSAVKPPTQKARSEAVNDAAMAAILKARDLPIGATNLRNLRRWGSELRVLDSSRYVPGFESVDVLWAAAKLSRDGDVLRATRRGFSEYGHEVAVALVESYREQANQRRRERATLLDAPYLPIYQVRAQAAFARRVTRALCDRALEALIAGEYPELRVDVKLHLTGTTPPPPSEPIYRRGGRRRYEVTMTFQREDANERG